MVSRYFVACSSLIVGCLMGQAAFAAAPAQDMFGFGGSPDLGFYDRVDTGYSFSRKLSSDFNNQDAGKSYIAGAGVGYQFTPNLRSDLTIGYRGNYKNSSTTTNPLGTFDSGGNPLSLVTSSSMPVTAVPVLLSGYVDVGKFGAFTPYVGGGLGFSVNRTGKTNIANQTSSLLGVFPFNTGTLGGTTRTAFAWQFGAGTSIDIYNNIKLDVGYRYLNMGTIKTKDTATFSDGTVVSGLTSRSTLAANEVQVGLRIGF